MRCPHCGGESRISRPLGDGRRVRDCRTCAHTWRTREIDDGAYVQFVRAAALVRDAAALVAEIGEQDE